MAGGVVSYILRLDDRASGALSDVSDEAEEAEDALDRASESSGRMRAGLASVAAAAVAAIPAVVGLAQSVADAVNDINDMSARTGLSADTLGALRVAAQASGRELSDMDSVINPMIARMGQAAKGSKEAAAAFAALGVSVTDGGGALRSSDAVLRDVVSAISDLPDPTQRAAAAMSVMGESGGTLVQVMGAGEIEDFAAFAREFGVDTGPAASRAAAEWQKQTTLLWEALAGVGASLIPLQTLSDFVGDLTRGFIFLGRLIPGVFRGMWEGAKAVLPLLKQVAIAVSRFTSGDFSGAADAIRAAQNPVLEMGGAIDDALTEALDAVARFNRAQRQILEGDGAGAGLPAAPAGPFTRPSDAGAKGDGGDAFSFRALNVRTRDRLDVPDDAGRTTREFLDNMESAAVVVLDFEEKTRRTVAEMLRFPPLMENIDEAVSAFLDGSMGAATAGLTGDVFGAVGMMGPQGAAIAGAGQALQQIGQVGAAGVEKKLDQLRRDLLAALDALPEIIGRVLPEAFVEAVPALIEALIEALPELLIAQAKAIATLIKAQFVDFPRAFAESITTLFLDAWDVVKQFFADLFSGRFRRAFGGDGEGGGVKKAIGTGARFGAALLTFGMSEIALAVGRGVKNAVENRSYDRGDYVDRTGLAMVHQGERIIRPTGAASEGTFGAAQRSMMGGGTVVVPPGITTVDELTQAIRDNLGTLGRGFTLDPRTA